MNEKAKSAPAIESDAIAQAEAAQAKIKTYKVVYIPDQFDPVETTVAGVRFRANVPIPLSRAQTTMVLLTEKFETKDGTVQSRAVEKRVPVVELLRRNPFFEIDGVRHERVRPNSKLPDTPEGYRGYAISWISQAKNGSGIRTRWDAEEAFRTRCGVESDDIAYIMPFLEMKIQECGEGGGILAA